MFLVRRYPVDRRARRGLPRGQEQDPALRPLALDQNFTPRPAYGPLYWMSTSPSDSVLTSASMLR